MKFLIETTGEFGLVDYGVNPAAVIPSTRPCVVEGSGFVTLRHHAGQLRTLGELKDEATDAEFKKYWDETKGDSELAVSSFLSTYGKDATPIKRKK